MWREARDGAGNYRNRSQRSSVLFKFIKIIHRNLNDIKRSKTWKIRVISGH